MLIPSLLAANIFLFTGNKDDSLKPQERKRLVKDDWAPVSMMVETLTDVILVQGILM